MTKTRAHNISWAVAALVAATALALLAGSAAFAARASALPAICDQYPGLPQCEEGAGGGGGGNPSGGGGGENPTAGGGAVNPGGIPGSAGELGGAHGKLPFTGYPLTPLVLVLLLLVVAGLTLRAWQAIRARVATAHGETG